MATRTTDPDAADALELVVHCQKAEWQWQEVQNMSDGLRRPAWEERIICLRELAGLLSRPAFSAGYDTLSGPVGVFSGLLKALFIDRRPLRSREQDEMHETLRMLERELRRITRIKAPSLASVIAEQIKPRRGRRRKQRSVMRQGRLDVFSTWTETHDWTRLTGKEIKAELTKDTGLELSRATISRYLKDLGKKPARREPRRTTKGRGEREAVAPLEAFTMSEEDDDVSMKR